MNRQRCIVLYTLVYETSCSSGGPFRACGYAATRTGRGALEAGSLIGKAPSRASAGLVAMQDDVVTLWRPVGPKELELIRQSGMRAFPPRLPGQPIFYPVLSEEYARKIARD